MKPTPPEIGTATSPKPYLPAVNVAGSGEMGKSTPPPDTAAFSAAPAARGGAHA